MKAFCVECGKEGVVYQGLCQDCLSMRRRFLQVPAFLDLHRCVHCGSFNLPGGWREASLEDAVREAVSGAVKVSREVGTHSLETDHAPSEGSILQARVHARLDLEGLVAKEEATLDIRIRGDTCPQCSRQRGGYYEAILQVRGEGRDLREEEVEKVLRLVYGRVDRDPSLFVSQEERIHGGLDLYLSSNRSAKALVRELRSALGGKVSSSPRLHTRKKGKDMYRVTHLLRVPGP